MNNPEVIRRIQEMQAREQQLLQTRDIVYQRAIGSRAGDCYGDCGDNMANLDCDGLSREKAATEEAMKKQQMAAESYKPVTQDRNPPAGYSNATDADLEALGLRDPTTGKDMTFMRDHRDFNAAVFKNDATGDYVIGFKGTEVLSGDDWRTNAGQNFGNPTAYYSQAMEIGRRANIFQSGKVSFVGHSLGGGLASAASAFTGRPATTFNAAGLHPNTVPRNIGNAPIDSWYVKGEALTLAQGLPGIQPANGRRIMINAPWSGMDMSPVGGPVTRHLNGRIADALDRRLEAIEDLKKEKGCPQ